MATQLTNEYLLTIALDLVMSGSDTSGICFACGSVQPDVKPAARSITCQHCGQKSAHNAQEAIFILAKY